MISEIIRIVLADDDEDDCLFFNVALQELNVPATLTILHDGEKLMEFFRKPDEALPQVLFLDLNMPRRNGFECLAEIKSDDRLKHIPVIILSTSYEESVVDLLYTGGAQYYVRKPSDISRVGKVIEQALTLIVHGNGLQPPKESFVLTGELKLI